LSGNNTVLNSFATNSLNTMADGKPVAQGSETGSAKASPLGRFRKASKIILAVNRFKKAGLTHVQLAMGELPSSVTKKKRKRRKSLSMDIDAAELEVASLGLATPNNAGLSPKTEEENAADVDDDNDELTGIGLKIATLSAIAQIFVGGCTAVIALESMLQSDRSCGPLVQLAQTAFVAIDSSRTQLVTTKGNSCPRLKTNTIPMLWHLGFVGICFTMSILSNMSHQYGISVPLHVVVKSSGLVVNMLVGAVLLRKRYKIGQIAAVLLILLGVLIVTLTPTDEKKDSGQSSSSYIGITMLLVSLFLSSLLGVLQEYSYNLYGKDWQESMFYSHFLSLPLFSALGSQVCMTCYQIFSPCLHHTHHTILTTPYSLQIFTTAATWGVYSLQWCWLLVNICMVYFGVRGIYSLTPLTSSLTTTLTMTVRKFTSLIISVSAACSHHRSLHTVPSTPFPPHHSFSYPLCTPRALPFLALSCRSFILAIRSLSGTGLGVLWFSSGLYATSSHLNQAKLHRPLPLRPLLTRRRRTSKGDEQVALNSPATRHHAIGAASEVHQPQFSQRAAASAHLGGLGP
jgi:UDP-xylose/UDP-N-acetylglucosamine transporter B4